MQRNSRNKYYYFTVAIYKPNNVTIPQFILKPTSMLDIEMNFSFVNFESKPGMKFENYPKFHKEYLLKAFDENSVYKLFKPRIIEQLMVMKPVYIESLENCIGIRDHIKYFHPKKIESYFNRIKEIIELFLK